ncbi:MAG: hypothetical protein ACR2MB_15075 [Acidimicrobiales bacterium]
MAVLHPRSDHPDFRGTCAELADRVPGLLVRPEATGAIRSPYASGALSGAAGVRVEVLRSVLWHGNGVVVRVAGGLYGAWAKPLVPDPDRQEGGLIFVPDHREPPAGGMLDGLPVAQAALHDLWEATKWVADDATTSDGLVIMVRPDGVVGHLHGPAVTVEALEVLVRHLPDVALAAKTHDPDWRETVHPPRDRFLWPAAVIAAGIVALVLLYLAYRGVR